MARLMAVAAVVVVLAAVGVHGASPTTWTCGSTECVLDECQESGFCHDGECAATPKEDGTPCNNGLGFCFQFLCVTGREDIEPSITVNDEGVVHLHGLDLLVATVQDTVTFYSIAEMQQIVDAASNDLDFYLSLRPGDRGEPGDPGPQGLIGVSEEGVVGIVGARGPPGPQGDQGEEGDQGAPGTDSVDHSTVKGPVGLPGAPGNPGPKGPVGDVGDPGLPGLDGEPGLPGIDNPAVRGDPGPKGPKGPVGDPGPTGLPGQDNPAVIGSPGPQGPQGDQGKPGPQGVGLVGPTGSRGPTGTAGPPGSRGPQGTQGNYGPPGAVGATGDPGGKGPKGDPGNTGAGVTGAPGPTGASGWNMANWQNTCTLKRCTGGDWIDCACASNQVVVAGGCINNASPHRMQISKPVNKYTWRCGGHGGLKEILMTCC